MTVFQGAEKADKPKQQETEKKTAKRTTRKRTTKE